MFVPFPFPKRLSPPPVLPPSSFSSLLQEAYSLNEVYSLSPNAGFHQRGLICANHTTTHPQRITHIQSRLRDRVKQTVKEFLEMLIPPTKYQSGVQSNPSSPTHSPPSLPHPPIPHTNTSSFPSSDTDQRHSPTFLLTHSISPILYTTDTQPQQLHSPLFTKTTPNKNYSLSITYPITT